MIVIGLLAIVAGLIALVDGYFLEGLGITGVGALAAWGGSKKQWYRHNA